MSEGLDYSGVTTLAGQQLMARAGSNRRKLLVLMMLLAALGAALITPNGAVAALLPVAVVSSIRMRLAPSLLLMPLAFAASAGSMLALTGTPVNVIVSEAAVHAGHHGFGYLEFALVGLPLVAGTVAICLLLGERLLPERRARSIPPDLSLHARTLADQYAIDEDVSAVTRSRPGC